MADLPGERVIVREAIGVNIGQKVKIAAGLFSADYGALGAQIEDLTAAGVDWLHLEMCDGRYMDFYAPRGGVDVLEAMHNHTDLEIEVKLRMARPNQILFKQLADLGASLVSLPIEASDETLIPNIAYIKETLGLKVGVWSWHGMPLDFLEPVISHIDIIEHDSRAPFWMPAKPSNGAHAVDAKSYREYKRAPSVAGQSRSGESDRGNGRWRIECQKCRPIRSSRHDRWRILFTAAEGRQRQVPCRQRRNCGRCDSPATCAR